MSWFRSLIFLVLLLYRCFAVFGENSDSTWFKFKNKIYSPGEEILIEFSPKVCARNFRVRVVSDVGRAEIFNESSGKWVSQSNVWAETPEVSQKMKTRISEINDKKVSISLEFQNISKGEIFNSPPIPLWISDYAKDYVDSIYLGGEAQSSESTPTAPKNTEDKSKTPAPVGIIFSVLLIGLFVVTMIKYLSDKTRNNSKNSAMGAVNHNDDDNLH